MKFGQNSLGFEYITNKMRTEIRIDLCLLYSFHSILSRFFKWFANSEWFSGIFTFNVIRQAEESSRVEKNDRKKSIYFLQKTKQKSPYINFNGIIWCVNVENRWIGSSEENHVLMKCEILRKANESNAMIEYWKLCAVDRLTPPFFSWVANQLKQLIWCIWLEIWDLVTFIRQPPLWNQFLCIVDNNNNRIRRLFGGSLHIHCKNKCKYTRAQRITNRSIT